jgi:hypothetical protein
MFKEDAESVQFLNDETVKAKLASAKKLSEINADDYDVIFYVGGHGPVIDLASDETNAQLASKVSRSFSQLRESLSFFVSFTGPAKSHLLYAMVLREFNYSLNVRLTELANVLAPSLVQRMPVANRFSTDTLSQDFRTWRRSRLARSRCVP